MRLVHSFTTKYCNDYQLKVNAYYFTLSAVYAKNSGFEIVLHTDNKGAEVLKDAPYDQIIIDLEIDDIPRKGVFAWAKFKAMENELVESIHIDGDVFLKKESIKEHLNYEDYDIIVQQLESTCEEFEPHWNRATTAFAKCEYPSFMPRYCANMYNCGIVGFKDKELYKEYTNHYFDLINQYNIFGIDTKGVPDLVAEQQLLYYFAKHKGLKVKELLKEESIQEMADELGYQHLLGESKYNDFEICKKVLNKHRPDLYQILKETYGELE